jgi:23S rRNA (cytosine1962-C5)-methyltransferase
MNEILSIISQNLLKTNDSSRLFHGRGRKWPGLEHMVIDFYSPDLLITLYKESSNEFIDELVNILNAIPNRSFENILLQKRYLSRPELIAIKGSIPNIAFAKERGSKFHLKFTDIQNIGFFLDMALGRQMLERISENKKVLNLFSYTCSLSIAALKGKAQSVVNVDMSKAALSVGESNHLLNNIDLRKTKFLPYDIMKSWNNIKKYGPYDIVVIDPPTNQGDSFKVERDYYKIVKRLNEMTSPEAVVIACLNSPYLTSQFLIELFSEHAPDFRLKEILYSAFQSMEVNPEVGLKIVVFEKKGSV